MVNTNGQYIESQPLLTVDNQIVSIAQAIKYLQAAGKMQPFVLEILRQHIIEQELSSHKDIEIDSAAIEQAIINFRIQNQLSDPNDFTQWLANNGTNYNAFHKQISLSFKIEKLKTQVTEPKLQAYFQERKSILDRIVISRIVVAQQELAEELRDQIEEGASFEQLAQEYSQAEDRIVNGIMGPLSQGTLPDVLRSAVDLASPGALLGPLEVDGLWGLFRVEKFLPATLEDERLQQLLRNEIFEQWIAEKIKKMPIKLQQYQE